MKICWEGFLGNNHSWSICGQNICRTLKQLGHQVDMKSTNGLEYFPDDLKDNLKENIGNDYDMCLSYTALKNFPIYLNHSKKNRFGIWCFEFEGRNSIPTGFAKHYKNCDKLLAPSNFAKKIFVESGIPESSIEVIPHGVDIDYFKNQKNKYLLKTKKTIKLLCNIGQPHIRKGLECTIEAYFKAFNKADDVCLVMKVVDKSPSMGFEVSFSEIYKNLVRKYPNHPEVEIITEFIPDISTLYAACDILLFLTRSECFSFTALEALASRLVVITSNYGGHLDFLSDKNSLLVDGNKIKAPPKALYWEQKPNTYFFDPNIDDAVSKLRYAVDNIERLKNDLHMNTSYLENYTWKSVVNRIMELVK